MGCDTVMDAEAARTDCNDVPACKAFSLVFAQFDGNARRCFKTSASPLQAATGICFYTKQQPGGAMDMCLVKGL
jgi:hypothetical protein